MTEEISPIDHKGRSRPIYERRSGGGGPVRTNRWTRLLVGLWPGLRIMAQGRASAGAPYALLGVLLVSQAVLLGSNWKVMEEAIAQYGAQASLLLVPGVLIWASVMAFELLRLATAHLRPPVPWARIMASFLVPCAGWCIFAPGLVALAPRWVEASAFAAAILAAAAVPATFASVVEVLTVASPSRRRWTRWAYAGMACLGFLIVALVVLVPHPEAAGQAEGAGWRVLAALLD
ncbi:MAG: hypothetical protein AAGD10_11470 [Myxococcota bacterium]